MSISTKVEKDYDVISEHFAGTRRNMHWPELDQMIDQVDSGSAILDIGCGSGRLCKQLQSKKVDYSGIDISQGLLDQAKADCPTGYFTKGTMTKLPYKDNQFDYVFMIASLHHLLTDADRLRALREAYRVLKPGGVFYCTNMGLFQKRYLKLFFLKSAGKASVAMDQKKYLRWNDVFLPWKGNGKRETVHRYYHAFTKYELSRLCAQTEFVIDDLSYVRNGQKVKFYKAKNIVLCARKVV